MLLRNNSFVNGVRARSEAYTDRGSRAGSGRRKKHSLMVDWGRRPDGAPTLPRRQMPD